MSATDGSSVASPAAVQYLRLSSVRGVGPVILGRLIERFGSVDAVFAASPAEVQGVAGVGAETAGAILRARGSTEWQREVELAAAHGVRIICRADPDYPAGLKHIPDAPIVLYVKGDYRKTDAVSLAIVGTRRCTIYGGEQARRFGELLAGAGLTVVSGLARGIDALAHHGAIDAGGRAIAVLGCGLTNIYPPENRALAERVLECGAWFSELPMQATVRPENFPSRNRIIAGMTLGTLVVEAPRRSGALITARLANEYNREVFAIPGRLQEPACEGSNALIRDGIAKLVTGLDDILSELGEVGIKLSAKCDLATNSEKAADTEAKTPQDNEHDTRGGLALSDLEKRVLTVIPFQSEILQDAVILAAQLPPGEVLAALTTLEIKGLIRRLPGNLVVRRGQA